MEIKNKLVRGYRKEVFREMVSCNHKDFKLVGPVTVINRNIKEGAVIGDKSLVKGIFDSNSIVAGISCKKNQGKVLVRGYKNE